MTWRICSCACLGDRSVGLPRLLHGVPGDAVLARAIACGGAFTAVNVAYLVAIEACRWRMHVHVKRAHTA